MFILIDNIVSELKNIKIVNEKIIADNKRLSDEVITLKSKIDEIEQHNLGAHYGYTYNN